MFGRIGSQAGGGLERAANAWSSRAKTLVSELIKWGTVILKIRADVHVRISIIPVTH